MEETRYRRGLETIRKLDEGNAARLEEALEGIAPDLYRYIVEFAFGDMAREVFAERDAKGLS